MLYEACNELGHKCVTGLGQVGMVEKHVRHREWVGSEVVREALRLLDERDRMREMRLEDLRKDIQIGLDQLDRGESIDGEEAMQQLIDRARQRAAEQQ